VKNLEAKLDSKHVKTRQVQETVLTYVEGWHVIAEANRIFGYDAWDRQTITTHCVWTGIANRQNAAAYMAKVRIAVRAGAITIIREGCGSGEGKGLTPGEAHELALKAAETDATKRALATFGNPFGLALYDRELAGVRNRKALDLSPANEQCWILRASDGKPGQSFRKPGEYADAVKLALSAADNIELLFGIWEQNVHTVRTLNKSFTNREWPETLLAHFKKCAANLARPSSRQSQRDQALIQPRLSTKTGAKIDKSALTLGEPRRIRSKEHLRFVA